MTRKTSYLILIIIAAMNNILNVQCTHILESSLKSDDKKRSPICNSSRNDRTEAGREPLVFIRYIENGLYYKNIIHNKHFVVQSNHFLHLCDHFPN